MTLWCRLFVAAIVPILAFCTYCSLLWTLPALAPPVSLASGLWVHPSEISRQVILALSNDKGTISAETIEAARRSELQDPFGTSLLLATGLNALNDGRFASAQQALTIAVKRNPRSVLSNAALAEAQIGLDQPQEAARQLVTLLRLMSSSRELVLPILFELVENPKTRDATIAAMADSPAIRTGIALQAARAGLEEDVIMALRNPIRSSDPNSAEHQQIGSLILPYIEAGNLGAARRLSEHFYGESKPSNSLLTDGRFAGQPGPPFGWTLVARPGVAFAEESKGLLVNLTSRQSGRLAVQTLTLKPGRYAMEFVFEGPTSNRSDLLWEIQCINSKQQVLELPFDKSEFFADRRSNQFSIPTAQCEAQFLTLVARRSPDLASRALTISEVSIRVLDQGER